MELVLTLNSFEFDGEHYLQTSSIAMGTKVGSAFACLFMGFLKERILQAYHGPIVDIQEIY
jgi:hypothetical protein